uniref:NADH dehydrogenase subunit 6 n=1 Tax=Ceratosolen solmsi TaxID=142686 RepID=D1FKC3_9HYME|nr:NADH dehydrogenase subunit 6 [Ceratosolen solmsi]AEG67047.1 NADH dehydrogenase subunit 6 [Ceratosolen solmsi]
MKTTTIILIIPMMLNLLMLMLMLMAHPNKLTSPSFNGIIILLISCVGLYSIAMYTVSVILPSIIFLAFVGGIMVVMMYFACFIDNEKVPQLNLQKILSIFFMLSLFMYLSYNNMKIYLPYIPDNMSTISIMEMIHTGSMTNYTKLSNIYLWENSPILMYLVLFMVFCFITMTKMCLTNKYKNIRKM